MKYSESSNIWYEIPEWVSYLLSIGYTFAESVIDDGFALVSMPCDSPGAGLVALGAMRYYLSLAPLSSDDMHKRIRESDVLLYSGRDRFRYLGEDEGRAVVEELIRNDYRRRTPPQPIIRTALLENLNLRFENETVLASSTEMLQYSELYARLYDGSSVNNANLGQSHSAVCLAGKRKGLSVTTKLLHEAFFRYKDERVSLYDLLSLMNGSFDVVSRVTLYNTRTEKMDRSGEQPEIIVTDGIDAFLKIIDLKRTGKISAGKVIGVLDRTEKREKINSVRDKVSGLLDYYEYYELNSLSEISLPPKGMALATYKRI